MAHPPTGMMISRQEVAKQTRLCEKTIQVLTAPQGPIPCVRIGRRVLYRPADIEAFLAQRAAESLNEAKGGA